MRNPCCYAARTLAVLLVVSGIALAQVEPQTRTVVVNGHSGQAAVIQQNGHAYVDLAALANIGNGSLSFSVDRMVLTLPAPIAAVPAAAEAASSSGDSGLSRDFMKAGVEEIALIREWARPLADAIQNGIPFDDQWVTRNRDRAANGLRMAAVAATTSADHNALQLLTNEFDGVGQWSDKMLAAKQSMDTAKYTMAPGTLRSEPLAQKLIACWQFLGSMLVSGSFQDDSSCH